MLGVRMRRRSFIALIGAVACWPLAARAEPLTRVGYIEGSRRAPYVDEGLAALGELGYVDGKNITFVRRTFAAFNTFRPCRMRLLKCDRRSTCWSLVALLVA